MSAGRASSARSRSLKSWRRTLALASDAWWLAVTSSEVRLSSARGRRRRPWAATRARPGGRRCAARRSGLDRRHVAPHPLDLVPDLGQGRRQRLQLAPAARRPAPPAGGRPRPGGRSPGTRSRGRRAGSRAPATRRATPSTHLVGVAERRAHRLGQLLHLGRHPLDVGRHPFHRPHPGPQAGDLLGRVDALVLDALPQVGEAVAHAGHGGLEARRPVLVVGGEGGDPAQLPVEGVEVAGERLQAGQPAAQVELGALALARHPLELGPQVVDGGVDRGLALEDVALAVVAGGGGLGHPLEVAVHALDVGRQALQHAQAPGQARAARWWRRGRPAGRCPPPPTPAAARGPARPPGRPAARAVRPARRPPSTRSRDLADGGLLGDHHLARQPVELLAEGGDRDLEGRGAVGDLGQGAVAGQGQLGHPVELAVHALDVGREDGQGGQPLVDGVDPLADHVDPLLDHVDALADDVDAAARRRRRPSSTPASPRPRPRQLRPSIRRCRARAAAAASLASWRAAPAPPPAAADASRSR